MTRIAVLTDSASYIPPEPSQRYGVRLVPLHILFDGQSYPETHLDVDDFYQRIALGATVSTSQPSPGDFVEAYGELAADGAEHILSIHIGGNSSGTVRSAQLAAESSPVPVDTTHNTLNRNSWKSATKPVYLLYVIRSMYEKGATNGRRSSGGTARLQGAAGKRPSASA